MPIATERAEILKAAAEHRAREVMHHQINIDNYRLAIAEIEANHADDQDMQQFAEQLRDLLASSLREQRKESIMLKVIESQIKG